MNKNDNYLTIPVAKGSLHDTIKDKRVINTNWKIKHQKTIKANYGRHPFSLAGDLCDRLGAPIEYRFSREDILTMFNKCGFENISVTKLSDSSGWVAWGYKA